MKGFVFRKLYILLFVSFLFGFVFFVLGQNDATNPPSALNYAPNFQFDPDEQYYPADPLDFYFENGEEIEGEKAVNKYNQLSLEAKLKSFTILYHIEDEGNHWVYQYWTFYVLNNSLGKIKNKHYGDWEAVFVFIDKNSKKVIKTIGTAHQRKFFDTEIENPQTNHIWAYIGNGSHAICIDNENDEYCDFTKWKIFEKWDKGGVKVKYGDYNLIEITQEYISQFNNATTLTKSPILGIDWLSLAGFSESENKEADNNFAVIRFGGSPPNYPWTQSMYSNPEEARPYSIKYIWEKIKEVGSWIIGFFGRLVDKVGDLFNKSAPLQPAGIGGALIDNPVFEIDNNLAISVEEKDAPIQEQEQSAPIIVPAPVTVEKAEEKPVEPVNISKEEPILIEENIEEAEGKEPIIQDKPPFSLPFFIGGGAPPEPEPEPEPEPDPDPDPDPDPELSPVLVLPPAITSHSSGDILGSDDDYSTSTAGFQINLIGTSSPDFLISISIASTTATTTADGNGNWSKIINLSEGENNLTVKAIDAVQNESEEALLNLTVDTTPPSDISDLSAVSGNTRGTINLSWTAPGDDESVGTSTEYIIRYATSSAITADNWASSTDITNEPTPSIASSTENLIITGLTSSETYYWAIKSEDDAGNLSGISNCTSSSPSAIAGNVVISEISVQCGTSRVKDEFIELYNPTGTSINLSGWSIKYASALSTTTWKYKYFNVDGEASKFLPNFNLPSHSYYLLTSATSSDSYSYGTAPDLTAITNSTGNPTHLGLSADGGKIKLLDNNSGIADLVAWEKDSLGAEGEPIDIDDFSWGSLERQAFATSTAELLASNGAHHWEGNNIDRNDNSQDFVLQTVPNPQNSFSLTEPETTFPVLADTDWPMLQGDVRHSGLSFYAGTATGTPTSTPKWTIDLGAVDPTSPVIASDGEIYIGSGSGKLYKISAINATGTAELFYDTQTGGTIQTPVIASNGTIYISDNQHYLYALSLEGQLKWKYNILDGSSPTIASDGTIYIGSSDGFHAINPNGERIWQNTQLSNGHWVKSPVLDSDGVIYTAGKIGPGDNSQNVYALNPQDGSIIWKSASSTFSTAPALSNDGTIFIGGIYGLYALNSFDGEPKWPTPASTGNINGSIPAIGQNAIYVGSYDYCLHAVDSGGANQWSYNIANTGGIISASPIIDAEGTIYIGSQSGMFYAFNPDGTVKWQAELNGAINSSAVIDANGTVYITSYNGTLYAFGK